ncbi:MAG: NAD-binding protein [Candidatus Micrarchaeota archaeon]|nr:NAD-binding protein [Candidatus Micrarchaeota archaeon]
MASRPEDETRNVLVSAVLIGALVMASSIALLFLLTSNIYLDAYYTIGTFFGAPNTAAAGDLAAIAFGSDPQKFAEIVGIVVVDNLSNIIVISFVIAAVLDIIKFTDLEQIINQFKASRLGDHVIVCGYNEVAQELVAKLRKKRIKVVVVDHDKKNEEKLNLQKIIVISGKFTEVEVLRKASIENAREIVFTSASDIDNLIGAITAKRLNEKIKIITRVSNDEIRSKMYRVGVDMCVLPEYLAGIELGEQLSRIMKVAK